MAALPVATVRSRVSSALDSLGGWSESRWGYELFGRDTDHLQHHAFAVGVPDTSVHVREGRQRPSDGALVETTVEVAWAHRLTLDAQVSAYDAALAAEQQAIQAVLAISRSDLHIVLDRMSRRVAPEGWVLGTLRFRALHRYALA